MLSMYVRTLGYGMSTVVETKGPTVMFATMWAVKMLNFLGLSDIILQCDPEPSLIKCAESVKSKRTERTVIRSSPRRSHQSNGGVENYQKQLQGQVRTMLAAMQEHTQYRPSADNALFYRAMGGPYRRKLVEFGETVLAHLPEVGKGSGNQAPKCVAGKKRPREVYDDSQRTAGQKRTLRQSSRLHRSRGRCQQMTQQIPEWYQKYRNKRIRTTKRTRTMMRAEKHPTSQTTRIMKWRGRRFQSQTPQRLRAQAEERNAQKHKKTCS